MKLSRRNFLKGTAALGATSVAPSLSGMNMAHAAGEDYKAWSVSFYLAAMTPTTW
ncbi:hypothetical protein JCM19237_2886 [Photobacterium aphoticum]|uniref:Twin-arginine translocation signal domain-containing protein n=1 Tax=Photobacterium aphoticum TaxID=754436 RepID=A0A090RLE8_9GAMM|nr:hypothetical protein JCM19237_2886 [Photobacterium aphoticum]